MNVVIAKLLSLLTSYIGEDIRLDRYTWYMLSPALRVSKVFAPRHDSGSGQVETCGDTAATKISVHLRACTHSSRPPVASLT